jgi:hypothetical protein
MGALAYKRPGGWRGEERKGERSVMLHQEYTWIILNTLSLWKAGFESDGVYARCVIGFSLSGLPSKEDLVMRIHGNDLGWALREDVGDHR